MIPNQGIVSAMATRILVVSLRIIRQIRRLFSHHENPSNVTPIRKTESTKVRIFTNPGVSKSEKGYRYDSDEAESLYRMLRSVIS